MLLLLNVIILFLVGALSLGHCLLCCGAFYFNTSSEGKRAFWLRQMARGIGYFVILLVIHGLSSREELQVYQPWIQSLSQFLLGLYLLRDFFRLQSSQRRGGSSCHFKSNKKLSSLKASSPQRDHPVVLFNYFLKTVSCGWVVFLLLSLSEYSLGQKIPLIVAFWLGSLPGFLSLATLRKKLSSQILGRVSLVAGSLMLLSSVSFLVIDFDPTRVPWSHRFMEGSQSLSRQMMNYIGDTKKPLDINCQ